MNDGEESMEAVDMGVERFKAWASKREAVCGWKAGWKEEWCAQR